MQANEKIALYVLFELPKQPFSQESILLSFLAPEKEQKLADSFSGRLLIGRAEMENIREKALEFYIDLVARTGATPCDGETLRKRLAIPGGGNPWWYHLFTAKNCEIDPTFNRILQIFTIDYVAEREQINEIVLYKGPRELADVLASGYKVIKSRKCTYDWHHALKGIFARVKYLYIALRDHILLKRHMILPDTKPEIAFEGFWDWSVHINEKNVLKDFYFTSLPEYLMSKGLGCAWLLWFAPHYKPDSKNRPLKSVLNPAKGHPQLIFLQKFLSIKDILFALADFRPFYRYLCFSRSKQFRALFKENHLDYWPLVHRQLLYNFCNSNLPHHALGEKAHRRAFSAYRPQVAFTFHELFLWSRVYYQGGGLGSPSTTQCTIQHASYNKEKTFITLDPEREYQGKPDGFTVPVPDYIFTMGELGRNLFLEDGFPEKKVFLTGSPKYSNVRIATNKLTSKHNSHILNVLLVTTLNCRLEMEMIQAAVLAVSGLKGIKLYLRNHPFAKMENLPEYKPYLSQVTFATGILEEDLCMADLVLFTYSSVAEEALLLGIPVCQWKPARFNGSVFRQIPVIPSFCTVEDLREFIKTFIQNPDSYKPTRETQELVLRQCFYKADAKASERIAEKIIELSKPDFLQTKVYNHERTRN